MSEIKETASMAGVASFVEWNGGSKCYQAPELFKDNGSGKFYKKSDVFSAGIVYLEIISLKSPEGLFKLLWPQILVKGLPLPLEQLLSGSLEMKPDDRRSFVELFTILEIGNDQIAGFCTSNVNREAFEKFLSETDGIEEFSNY